MPDRIALSIDMDFFVREKPEWDFGHSETALFMGGVVWQSRYQMYDLYRETSSMHADCKPQHFFDVLGMLGFVIGNDTKIGAGWSHKDAYNFFLLEDFDRIINLDAHHDCYEEGEELDCGNWLRKLLVRKGSSEGQWIYPRWLKHKDKTTFVDAYSFDYAAKLAGDVVAIYIAQSPAWVPPHHDIFYDAIIRDALMAAGKSKFDYDGKRVMREAPSKKEAAKWLKEYQCVMEKFRKEHMGEVLL